MNTSQTQPNALKAIFWGGLIAGTMDITAACTQWALKGVSPVRILQSVASGALGADAFKGGWPTATLGLAFHFFIATTATTVFFLASRKIEMLTKHWVVSGVLYGVTVYMFMYWVVVPLSNARMSAPTLQLVVIAVLVHIFCVGLPIAWAVKRA